MASSPNRLLALLLLWFQAVVCKPTVSFPFNAQLPPVARIGSLYSFSLSSHTFNSDSSITYSLGHHPDWLSIEGDERRLYGIPHNASVPAGEVVGQSFQIIATDGSGSATMDATIVVSRDDEPTIKNPVSEQIKHFGDYSAPSSILSYPSTDFSYTFDSNTFQHEPDKINYYASSDDGSPLPSWIHFDSSTLTFSGKTPPADALLQPPQTFNIRLVASDIKGFSAISVEFSIVVSSHKISTESPVVELNATRGSSLEYDGLSDGIKLDNHTVDPGDLNVTTTDLPDWLTFDPKTWILKGKPGKDDHSTNFTIRFTDAFSDSLEVAGTVNIATHLFEMTFNDVEAIPGENFTLDLASYFKDAEDIQVKINTDPQQQWLHLDGLKLAGQVPKSASGEVRISVEAKSQRSGSTETETLPLVFLAPDGSSTISPTAATSIASETPHGGDTGGASKDATQDDNGGIGTSAILLATIIPTLAVALLVMLLVCFVRRRRNRQTYLSNKFRSKISHPVLASLGSNGSGSADGRGSYAYRTEKGTYVQAIPRPSSRSSDTLGSLSSRDMSQAYMHNAVPELSRDIGSSETEEGGGSWLTVSRPATAARSDMSSEATVPYSTHQLLPTPPFLAQSGENGFRNGLDLTIPSLDELPSMQQTSDASSYPDQAQSEAWYSTITTSSAALPSSRPGSPSFNPQMAATAENMASGSKKTLEEDWNTIHEDMSEEKVPELALPDRAQLSSRRWTSQRTGGSSWMDRGSSLSVASFGPSENWRVIRHPEKSAPNLSYKEPTEQAPFHLTRSSTPAATRAGARKGAQPGERVSSPPATNTEAAAAAATGEEPSKQARRKTSMASRASTSRKSRYSRLNDDEQSRSRVSSHPNWRREESGKASEGSFKVFI